MDERLQALEAALKDRPGHGPLSDQDLPHLLAWAVRLTDAGYGYLNAGDEYHQPDPDLVTVPEAPWPGVNVPLKACLAFAAQTAGHPVVFDAFPPRDTQGARLGADFVAAGGRAGRALPSPGGFLVAPLRGWGRTAGLLLDAKGRRFGAETVAIVQALLDLASDHGGPLPAPDAVLCEGDEAEDAARTPVLEWQGRRVPLTGPVTIGQEPRCELSVDDGLTSRRHCMVVPVIDGTVLLVDLRSSNGTWVNGEKVETHLLEPGDVIHTAKRHWTAVFRRVAHHREEGPLPPEQNRVGFDLTADGGKQLLARLRAWSPPGAARLGELCELVALQLGVDLVALLWTRDGALRFQGATAAPAPAPLAALDPRVARLRRVLAEKGGRDHIEAGGGLLSLEPAPVGEQAWVAWTQREGQPRPDPDAMRSLFTAALSGPADLRLQVPGDAEVASFRQRAGSLASGRDLARLVQEMAAAGFPADALEMGRESSRRFLDADEVEAALAEIEGLLG